MAWYHRILNVFRSARISREIDREMAFHIAERRDALIATGMSEDEARQLARRQFGNPTALGERARAADIFDWLQSVVGDVRYALRALARSPAFTVVAIASLGLGIGANTTIFSLIDALVLRTLPVAHPEKLLQVSPDSSAGGGYFTNPLWEQLRDRQDVFAALAAFGGANFNLSDGGEARRVDGAYVSGDYFATFLVQPVVGRLTTRTDDARGCPGVAVLSHRFWQREFGGSLGAVGRTIRLTGHPFEIVGVASADFRGPDVGREADVYVPLCSKAIIDGRHILDARSSWYLRVIGRTKEGVDLVQVQKRVSEIARASYEETVPQDWATESKKQYITRSFHARPAERGLSQLRSQYSRALFALMAGVALVLLIACANVANLLLARGEARQHELAIRLSIGAARARLIRQMLTESAVLAAAGAVLGMFVARWGKQSLVGMIGTGTSSGVSLDLTSNGRVLLFTSALATLTVIVFGLVPAWRATRVHAHAALKAQGRGLVEGHSSRWSAGNLLVTVQVALSLVLVVGAGLFVGTLRNLTHLNPGFSPNGVLLVDVDLSRSGLNDDAGVGAVRRTILERARSLPGVVNASTADITPAEGNLWNDELVVSGFEPKTSMDAVSWFNEVSDGYFSTLQTRFLAGRDFEQSDVRGSTPVAIVNDAWARHFLGNANPLGKQFRTKVGDTTTAPVTIIGVVENSKYRSLRDGADPITYILASQSASWHSATTLILRTRGDPKSLVGSVTSMMRDVRSGITLDFTTMLQQLSDSLQRERLLATLSAIFGAVALALAMLGLYGTMSYRVARRRGELGVRIALGAGRRRVLGMVLGEAGTMVILGVTGGAIASIATTKLIATFLFELEPTEPGIYLLATALLGVVALGAGLLPAWRAARVDPIAALREE
jgi:putative ABC transport system permease protein